MLGITTGALEAAAHIKLARANLNRFFSFGGYGSDSADRGELTRKAIDRAEEILGSALGSQRVLVVGDTPNDIAAAHAAGAIGIGVASGHSSKQELYGAGADYVLGSLLEELPAAPGRCPEIHGPPETASSRIIHTPWPGVCERGGRAALS